ncbi:MAG TPA: 3-dehydroquinate synthase family protein [Acidimicrobiia bacterium]|nr:3-dehydroquinate synthase family protein [Acidimicrobiia bacterium]
MESWQVAGATAVVVGRGVLDAATVLGQRPGRARVAVLVQPGEPARIGAALVSGLRAGGLAAELRLLPDGEAAKTLAVAEEVYGWLAGLALTRGDTVLGVGGGALTDLAGFVAATFLRGIEAVYVPTTLLGAVDAAIGGKTGVNLGAKNLVGSFHHPARVVIDADLLDALPLALRRDGAAEALKAGLIGDPGLVALYERDGLAADLAEVVRRAVVVKAAVVGRDFREQGERAHLNYGHTVGHALEVAAALGHGPAVAVGMVAAGRASGLVTGFGEETRQREVIAQLGLPVSAPGADAEEVRRLLGLDKKRDGGGLRMVLLERIGHPLLQHVGAATVESALAAVCIS